MSRYYAILALPDWADEILHPSRWDWGDVPTWIQAIATFLALIAATIAAIVTVKMLGVENRRDKKQRKAQKRLQAEQVAIWVVPTTRETATYSTVRLVDVHYANLSRLPIYEAIIVMSNGKATFRLPILTLPPTPESVTKEEISNRLDTFLKAASGRGRYQDYPIVLKSLDIQIVFNDAAGRRWVRYLNGKLNREADDYEPATATELPPTPPELEGF